jgi:hypothetical protein
MSRRARLIGHVTLLLLSLGTGLPVAAQEKAATTQNEYADKIARAYNLQVIVEKPTFPVVGAHGKINGEAAAPKNSESYLQLLAEEWSLYPPELIKKLGLRRIILCEALSFAGQLRTAIPDFEHDDLYLDVGSGRYDDVYVRKVIHHELFHFIDWRNGTLYRDERWAALLPPGVKYGRGGKNAQDDATGSLLDNRLEGFVNRYSMSGVEEDKAEVFCHMIVCWPAVEERVKTDKYLKAKVQLMREVLEKYCPQMNQSFWDAARNLKRPRQCVAPTTDLRLLCRLRPSILRLAA